VRIKRSVDKFNGVFCAAGLHPGAIAAIVIGTDLSCCILSEKSIKDYHLLPRPRLSVNLSRTAVLKNAKVP